MTDLENSLKKIKNEITAKTEQRIRAETEKELAEQEIERGMDKLRDSFKCETIEDARKLQSKLQSTLEAKISELQEALGEFS